MDAAEVEAGIAAAEGALQRCALLAARAQDRLAAGAAAPAEEARALTDDAENRVADLLAALAAHASRGGGAAADAAPLAARCGGDLAAIAARREAAAAAAALEAPPRLAAPPGADALAAARRDGRLAHLLGAPPPARPARAPAPPPLRELAPNQRPAAPQHALPPHAHARAPAEPSRWAPKVPRREGEEDVGRARSGRGLYAAEPPAGSEGELGEGGAGAAAPLGAGAGAGAFRTARAQLAADARRRGDAPPPPARAPSLRANAPGLRRAPAGAPAPAPGPALQGAGGKFVPPFVRKALEGDAGGGGGGNGGGGNGNGGGGAAPGPVVPEDGTLSARSLELLRLAPGAPLPERLAALDLALVEQVCREAASAGAAAVAWDDIAGQAAAKRLLQEIIVWPMLNPHIFTGARAPPKGILLFGPPGTGKTLLGRAVASQIDAAFFSISASSLTSKWIGEGEKLVRALFAVAALLSPAVIFIDEIDSLLSTRKAEGEHEASRRLKTELLVQMEGCGAGEERVLIIGASNRPEELDEAARRRLPKQLYIPLPCADARRWMVTRAVGPPLDAAAGDVANAARGRTAGAAGVRAALSSADLEKVVAKTEGYSGSDMRNLLQEACQGPVRDAVRAAAAAGGGGAAGVAALREADLRPVALRDFAAAARAQRASVEPGEVARYEGYNARHGARFADEEGARGGAGGEEDDGW